MKKIDLNSVVAVHPTEGSRRSWTVRGQSKCKRDYSSRYLCKGKQHALAVAQSLSQFNWDFIGLYYNGRLIEKLDQHI